MHDASRITPGGGFQLASKIIERGASALDLIDYARNFGKSHDSYESDWLECKRSTGVDRSDDHSGIWRVTEAAISMMNWCGGVILLGVDESPDGIEYHDLRSRRLAGKLWSENSRIAVENEVLTSVRRVASARRFDYALPRHEKLLGVTLKDPENLILGAGHAFSVQWLRYEDEENSDCLVPALLVKQSDPPVGLSAARLDGTHIAIGLLRGEGDSGWVRRYYFDDRSASSHYSRDVQRRDARSNHLRERALSVNPGTQIRDPWRVVAKEMSRVHGTMTVLDGRRVPTLEHLLSPTLLRDVAEVPRASRSEQPPGENQGRGGHRANLDHPPPPEPLALVEALEHAEPRLPALVAGGTWVVLGTPGSGKSSLLEHLAARILAKEFRPAGRPSLTPIVVQLSAWERSEEALPHHLTQLLGHIQGAPSPSDWHDKLKRGAIALLLDGMDELRSFHASCDRIRALTREYSQCPIVVTCRAHTVDYKRAVPDAHIFTLAGLEQEEKERLVERFPFESKAQTNRAYLRRSLVGSHQLASLARNPLMLSALCLAVEEGRSSKLPDTQGALLARVLEQLLARFRERSIRYPGPEPTQELRRRALEELAFRLVSDRTQSRVFAREESVLAALEEMLATANYGPALRPWAVALLHDIESNTGLLRRGVGGNYFFLHGLFQEYLAASYIAQSIDGSLNLGSARIRVGSAHVQAREFLDQAAWNPDWKVTLSFLAGLLDDPTEFLLLLLNGPPDQRQHDDVFRHRLSLAASVVEEIPVEGRAACRHVVDGIAGDLFDSWREHAEGDTEVAVPHMEEALLRLAQFGARVRGSLLVERAIRAAASKPAEAAKLLIAIAPIAVRADIADTVLDLIEDDPYSARGGLAVGLVDGLGPDLATPAFLEGLARLIAKGARQARVSLILGERLATAGFIQALVEILERGHDGAMLARDFLMSLACAIESQEIVDRLGTLLIRPVGWKHHDQAPGLAADVLKAMGRVSASPELLARMSTLLESDDHHLRADALVMFSLFGFEARDTATQETLTRLLCGENRETRVAAAEAIGYLDYLSLAPTLVELLRKTALEDKDDFLRLGALEGLARLQGREPTSEEQALLLHYLDEGDWPLKGRAVEVVDALGVRSSQDQIAESLGAYLLRSDTNLPTDVAQALCALKPCVTPSLVSLVESLLRRSDRTVQGLMILARLGSEGAVGSVPAELVRLGGPLSPHSNAVLADQLRTTLRVLACPSPSPALFDVFVQLLEKGGATALQEVDLATTKPNLRAHISQILAKGDREARTSLAIALSYARGASSYPGYVDCVLDLLSDDEWVVNAVRLQSLEPAGPPTMAIFNRVSEIMQSPHDDVCYAAILTLAHLSSGGVFPNSLSPDFVRRLVQAMRDESLGGHAAYLIEQLGPVAAESSVVAELDRGLRRESSRFPALGRSQALRALGAMGTSAASDRVVKQLIRLLRSEDHNHYGLSAQICRDLQASGIRIFVSRNWFKGISVDTAERLAQADSRPRWV